MANTVGKKGQIVIEKSIRDALDIQSGYVTVQRLVDDHIEVYFYPPEHNRSLKGILAKSIQTSVPAEQWADAREKAWSASARHHLQDESDSRE